MQQLIETSLADTMNNTLRIMQEQMERDKLDQQKVNEETKQIFQNIRK